MIRFQETNIKIQIMLDKAISLNEQVAPMNDERQQVIHNEITRNYPISRNYYLDTNPSGISISIDHKTAHMNGERHADAHNEI